MSVPFFFFIFSFLFLYISIRYFEITHMIILFEIHLCLRFGSYWRWSLSTLFSSYSTHNFLFSFSLYVSFHSTITSFIASKTKSVFFFSFFFSPSVPYWCLVHFVFFFSFCLVYKQNCRMWNDTNMNKR